MDGCKKAIYVADKQFQNRSSKITEADPPRDNARRFVAHSIKVKKDDGMPSNKYGFL